MEITILQNISAQNSFHSYKKEIGDHTWRRNKTAQVLLEFSLSQPFSSANLSFQVCLKILTLEESQIPKDYVSTDKSVLFPIS